MKADRAIEDGDLAARWAGSQYTVAMFAEHCERVESGKQGFKRATLEREVRSLTRRAGESLTERERSHANAVLDEAGSALVCEPQLVAELDAAQK